MPKVTWMLPIHTLSTTWGWMERWMNASVCYCFKFHEHEATATAYIYIAS